MVWRIFGWVSVIYFVLGTFIFIFVASTTGITEPGMPVDWSIVPRKYAAALWMARSLLWIPAFTLACLPAPFGFFRQAQGLPAKFCLGLYATATLLLAAAVAIVPMYLLTAESIMIRTSRGGNTWVIYTWSDVAGSLVTWIIFLPPALAALILLAVKSREQAFKPPANHPEA